MVCGFLLFHGGLIMEIDPSEQGSFLAGIGSRTGMLPGGGDPVFGSTDVISDGVVRIRKLRVRRRRAECGRSPTAPQSIQQRRVGREQRSEPFRFPGQGRHPLLVACPRGTGPLHQADAFLTICGAVIQGMLCPGRITTVQFRQGGGMMIAGPAQGIRRIAASF